MEASIIIQNLKCGGCANTITKGLTEINGVTEVKIDVENNVVDVNFDNDKNLEEIKTKLKKMGYPEEGENNSLGSKAKSYVSCAIGKMG